MIFTSSPAFFALSTPATVERELITTATSAFSLPCLTCSMIFIKVRPPPLISTPSRIGFLFCLAGAGSYSTSRSRFKDWLTSLSASLFSPRGTKLILQSTNSSSSSTACLKSGLICSLFTLYVPFICLTSSSLSLKTTNFLAPISFAASRAFTIAVYSATLFVARPKKKLFACN